LCLSINVNALILTFNYTNNTEKPIAGVKVIQKRANGTQTIFTTKSAGTVNFETTSGTFSIEASQKDTGTDPISVQDALYILQHIVELRTLNTNQIKAADINGDGSITIQDALKVLQHNVELTTLNQSLTFLDTNTGQPLSETTFNSGDTPSITVIRQGDTNQSFDPVTLDIGPVLNSSSISISEMTKTASVDVSDLDGGSVSHELQKTNTKNYSPTHTIGNEDGSNYILNNSINIQKNEVYQLLSDIQINDGASLTIEAGGTLISKYTASDGTYNRPPFSNGITFTNTYGENIVLVSSDGYNYEESHSVGNQNIFLFGGGSFKVEGSSELKAEMRGISVVFANTDASNLSTIEINHLNWYGGTLHPFYFKRSNTQANQYAGNLTLKNSYLNFVNSVNLIRLDKRGSLDTTIIEDNVFHNAGGFSLDFNKVTSGLLRIQKNIFFGEEVWRTSKPAFLSIGITGGDEGHYQMHSDGETKVLFKDNAFISNSNETKAITCEGYDPFVPWKENYFGYASNFSDNVRPLILDKNNDLAKTCEYPDSLISTTPARTWVIKPEVIVYDNGNITMDIPIDYESATNKELSFGLKSTDDESIESFFKIDILITNEND